MPHCSSRRAITPRSRLTSSTSSSTTRSINVRRSRAPLSMLSKHSSLRLPTAMDTKMSYPWQCQG